MVWIEGKCNVCITKLSGSYKLTNPDKPADFPECQRCEKYIIYINSPLWKNRSFDFKCGAGGICSICSKHVGVLNLQTHHIKYPTDFKDDSEANWIAVCADCHDKLHGVEA